MSPVPKTEQSEKWHKVVILDGQDWHTQDNMYSVWYIYSKIKGHIYTKLPIMMQIQINNNLFLFYFEFLHIWPHQVKLVLIQSKDIISNFHSFPDSNLLISSPVFYDIM